MSLPALKTLGNKDSQKTYKNPYELDRTNEGNLAALTRKNADFIEGIVRLDSNYAKDLQITEPNKNFDGSTAYWFDEMNKGRKFEDCVLGAITAIDKVNSTHLEASKNGREEMKNRICLHCKNVAGLIEKLNTTLSVTHPEHLISILTDKIEAKKEGETRYNLSFASKFCAYASIFLDTEVKYAKYDNVVSDALPKYMKVYCGENRTKSYYKPNNSLREEQKLENRLKVYKNYSADINRLKDVLQENEITMTLEEIDQIIWYANKG